MNKSQLISRIAQDTKCSKTDIEKIITSMLEIIVHTVATGERVTLVGFGSFEARERKARQGRNPRTGEKLFLPSTRIPTFSVGNFFRNKVNKKLEIS